MKHSLAYVGVYLFLHYQNALFFTLYFQHIRLKINETFKRPWIPYPNVCFVGKILKKFQSKNPNEKLGAHFSEIFDGFGRSLQVPASGFDFWKKNKIVETVQISRCLAWKPSKKSPNLEHMTLGERMDFQQKKILPIFLCLCRQNPKTDGKKSNYSRIPGVFSFSCYNFFCKKFSSWAQPKCKK